MNQKGIFPKVFLLLFFPYMCSFKSFFEYVLAIVLANWFQLLIKTCLREQIFFFNYSFCVVFAFKTVYLEIWSYCFMRFLFVIFHNCLSWNIVLLFYVFSFCYIKNIKSYNIHHYKKILFKSYFLEQNYF